ncbi:unnamed protein product [Discula destructiva]
MLPLPGSRSGRLSGLSFIISVFLLGFILGRFLPSLYLGTLTLPSYSVHNQATEIPPILHYTVFKAGPEAKLHIPFEAFLSVYSAFLAVSPSAIYIHTDHSTADVAHAIEHGSSWTKKLLAGFPPGIVRPNYVQVPTHTPTGVPITRLEHKSDFVRHEQLGKYGGVYLDWDVLTLKPLAPLLHSGFRAVVGKQWDRLENDEVVFNVNSGIVLATKDSALVRLMNQEAPRVYDGKWITHAVHLLTNVSFSLASVPGEVLIMDQKAFAPSSWEQGSVNALLERHGEAGTPEGFTVGRSDLMSTNPVEVYEETRQELSRTGNAWEYDFSEAYFIHKFFNDVENPRGYHGVSVPYILARDSNYARAAWAIVQRGIEDGLVDEKDDTL